jgi:hypothetical protein
MGSAVEAVSCAPAAVVVEATAAETVTAEVDSSVDGSLVDAVELVLSLVVMALAFDVVVVVVRVRVVVVVVAAAVVAVAAAVGVVGRAEPGK